MWALLHAEGGAAVCSLYQRTSRAALPAEATVRKEKLISHLQQVQQAVNKEIRGHASRGRIAAGLAGEGYAGGYRDALADVILLMDGVCPDRRHYWWHIHGTPQ